MAHSSPPPVSAQTTGSVGSNKSRASSLQYKLRSLPVIDISPWVFPEDTHHRGHNGGRQSTSAALHAACLTYGFFYLDVSSFVEDGECEALADAARAFFALPQEEKDKIGLVNQDGARGYQRLRENVTNGKADNHEGIDFYRPVENPDRTKPLQGENQWPKDAQVPGFQERYEHWIEKMKKLGMIVMQAMAVGLGMTPEEWEELKSKVDDSFWVMRIIGYPPIPNDYDGYSCGAHKDYGCLTFLYADPTPDALQVFLPQHGILDDAATMPIPANAATEGLAPSAASLLMEESSGYTGTGDVMMRDGDAEALGEEEGVWISADPKPGCVVCNIGEMWEVWTNGLYKSTLHRVVHRGSNYRVSIPFFYEPNFNARVAPLPAAIRLQKDSIQPAYVYVSHSHTPHPHTPAQKSEHGSFSAPVRPADQLVRLLTELTELPGNHHLQPRVTRPLNSSSGSSVRRERRDSDAESHMATAGWESVRSAMSVTSDDAEGMPSPITPQTPAPPPAPELKVLAPGDLPVGEGKTSTIGEHEHSLHTPMSVETRYQPVVYGEFLMKKVSGNFVNGKREKY